MSEIIAVQVCAGLFNRDTNSPSIYTLLNEPYDSQWLYDVEGISSPSLTSVESILDLCLSKTKKYILFSYSTQQALVPNLITLSAVLDAVPLEASSPAIASAQPSMVYDLTTEWSGFTPNTATSYMYDLYVNQTSTLAWMNPGYDNAAKPSDPPLTKSPNPGLIDYIVRERIFNFYMNDACIPNTDDYAMMTKMLQNNPWAKPIAVYGYGDTYPVAGDIFEAETDCTKEHNMGQIASSGVNNLSFFSRKAAITSPLQQNPVQFERFNPTKTYVNFVLGDGDNIAFVKSSRRDWMLNRISRCTPDKSNSYEDCFPLTWSLSPHLLHFAPDLALWYYNAAKQTGHDYFMLPPSGDLYSYPSEFPDDLQTIYAKNTAQGCYLMNTSGTVHWEWFGHWSKATSNFFPRYDHSQVKGIFPVNVPFNVPMVEVFRPGEFYHIIGDSVVLFRPREWRGTSPSNIPFSHREYLSIDQMAAELNHLPRGTVTWIYLTSDGGGNLDNIYGLVSKLDDHVKVVNHEVLVDLALQKEGK